MSFAMFCVQMLYNCSKMLNMEDALKSFVNKRKIFKLRKVVHIRWKFDTRSRVLGSDCILIFVGGSVYEKMKQDLRT
jgi:hypothetical protein